jgi:predicted  nucleic acid-binding Zn-ribbon protein
MNEKLKPFVALQELDTRRQALRRRLEDALKRRETIKADLKAAQAGKEKADDAKRIREKHLAEAQLRLKSAEERRKQNEARQLKITNQKEFQAIADQLAAVKAEIGTIEEEVLGLMDAVEGVRRDAEFAAKALRDQEERTGRIDAELTRATEADLQEMAKIDAEIAAQEAGVDRELLSQYKSLVRRANAIAVAAAVNGVCQACYTKLPPQVENLILGGGVVNCRSCGVFLYRG